MLLHEAARAARVMGLAVGKRNIVDTCVWVWEWEQNLDLPSLP